MSALDSIKDPNTGKIKKPILISMIGAGGLVVYLLISSKSGETTANGQSSSLTPDLTGLQDALRSASNNDSGGRGGGGGGASGSSPSLDPPPGFGTVSSPSPSVIATPSPTPSPTPIDSNDMPIVNLNPYVDEPGDSGNAGGGGSGTTTLLTPIAKSPDVYGGISVPLIGISIPTPIKPKANPTGPSRIYEPSTPTPKANPTGPSRIYEPSTPTPIMRDSGGNPIVVGGMTIPTIPLPPRIAKPISGGGTWGTPRSGGGTWGTPKPKVSTPKPKVKVVTPTPLRTRTSPVAT